MAIPPTTSPSFERLVTPTYPRIRESVTPTLGIAAFSHENVGQMNIYQEGA